MSEIKTCEQYVLQRLARAEDDVEALKIDIQCKDAQVERLTEELKRIKSFIKAHAKESSVDEKPYISFDSFWSEYDVEEYKAVHKFLHADDNVPFEF